MKHFFLKCVLMVIISAIMWAPTRSYSQTLSLTYDAYLTPDGLNDALKSLSSEYSGTTKLHQLANTPGNRELFLLEIGPETGLQDKTLPAVLVVGNMEGDVPISSMAAIYLADFLLHSGEHHRDKTWYILPCGNPDALNHYFSRPLYRDVRNEKPRNDDMDDRVDEDGYDDLDGNGLITQMRVKDPEGTMIPVAGNERMLRKADPLKAEKGMYKIYTEGVDDDGDGKYNEDGPGGINVGINFPHLFEPFKPTTGLYPGCTDESFQVFKFAFDHPEIAMTMTFGATNFCLVPPKGGRQSGVDMDKIKVPERMAEMINADPEQTYSMKEIMDMVQPMLPPGMEVTESMIASFLGLGAVVNPLQEDLKIYNDLAEKYKEYLKEKGMDAKRLDPASAKDGSFELWSYYHLGVHTFSMDFWTLPEVKEEKKEESGITIEKLETMTSDEFVALGEAKIDAFLKEVGAPDQYKAAGVIKMVESGTVAPKQMAQMMKQMPKPKNDEGGDPRMKALLAYSDQVLDGKGFVDWQPFNHPTLGAVEIGGEVAYVDNTPPADYLDSLFSVQVPWVATIGQKLPRMAILKTEVNDQGAGVYEVAVWIENQSYLPFPTAMGKRNQQPAPAVLTIGNDDVTLLSGKKRTPVQSLDGYSTRKLTWIIQSDNKTTLDITLSSANAWGDQKQIKIGD
jgi:hypothetical protein